MKKLRNAILGYIQKNDPNQLKEKVVKPEKGKGRKERPRDNKIQVDDFSCAA